MNRRQLLKSTLAATSGGLINQFAFAKNSFYSFPNNLDPNKVIEPFKINFDSKKIDNLYKKLDNTEWPEIPFDTGWKEGTNYGVLKDLVMYWRTKYDWFKEQEVLNEFPNFRATIEDKKIHFLHYKATSLRQSYPLLLLHGWPSTYLEFSKAAPQFSNGVNGQQGFDVVVPSLPGYAFSDIPPKGSNYIRIGEQLHTLMKMLGYEKYFVVAGDWGGVIANGIAKKHPEAVQKLFMMGCWGLQKNLPEKGHTEDEIRFLEKWKDFQQNGKAYADIQGTKPLSLAYGLQDSPVGLLAWILEKYWAWTFHKDDLWAYWSKEYILNTATIYLFTNHVFSASQYYYEHWHRGPIENETSVITVPTKWSAGEAEPWTAPESLIDTSSYKNFVEYTYYKETGHFPAVEQTEKWVRDVSTFFSRE